MQSQTEFLSKNFCCCQVESLYGGKFLLFWRSDKFKTYMELYVNYGNHICKKNKIQSHLTSAKGKGQILLLYRQCQPICI